MQFDMFAAPKTVMRHEMSRRSYLEIEVASLEDGSFGYRSDYQFDGYCGGASPIWPMAEGWPSARDAVAVALDKMQSSVLGVQRDRSSVCTGRHKADAAKALVWLEAQYAAYGLDPMRDFDARAAA